MNHVILEEISLKNHPTINEKWIQDLIANDPSILGLGELFLKDKERIQQGAGRLDLLFQEIDSNRRYEVELQLGKSDESHIIRTIEYWDIEKRRYPQYQHCAVIIAEDITSRFLNIISLFNGFIPIIALQMKAVKVGDDISLIFTKVIDKITLGLVDDDIPEKEQTDRDYWLKKSSTEVITIADGILPLIKQFKPNYELNYNKHYIGLKLDGISNNFCLFTPKKKFIWLRLKMAKNAEMEADSEQTDIIIEEYDTERNCYWIKLSKGEEIKNAGFLQKYLEICYKEFNKEIS